MSMTNVASSACVALAIAVVGCNSEQAEPPDQRPAAGPIECQGGGRYGIQHTGSLVVTIEGEPAETRRRSSVSLCVEGEGRGNAPCWQFIRDQNVVERSHRFATRAGQQFSMPSQTVGQGPGVETGNECMDANHMRWRNPDGFSVTFIVNP